MPLITRAARDYELISGYINTRGYTAVELGRAAKLSWRSLVISRPLTCVMNRMVIRRTCVFEEASVRRSNQLDTYQETRACAHRNPLGGFRAVSMCFELPDYPFKSSYANARAIEIRASSCQRVAPA